MRLTRVALARLEAIGAAFYSGGITRDAARSAVIDVVSDRLSCSRVSLWRFEGRPGDLSLLCFASKVTGAELVTTESWLRESEYRDYFDTLVNSAMYVCADALADANLQPMRDHYLLPNRVRAMLDAAFMINGRVYGMVCCEQTDRPRRWREGEIVALRAIVTKLALVMATAPDPALWGAPSLPMAPLSGP